MPKAPMKAEELQEVKNRILDVAAEIVMRDGYKELTMRKIGSNMGMSAASIYNYYSSKDEINIALRRRAGEMLYEELLKTYESHEDLKERGWRMVEAYLRFGMREPNYYVLLLDPSAPNHQDYVGTELEEAARAQFKSMMRTAKLMVHALEELADAGYRLPGPNEAIMIALWGELHGLVSLHNNRMLRETEVINVGKMFYEAVFQLLEPAPTERDIGA